MNRTRTQSTRYLCSAVQLNENFCDLILKDFFEEDYTAIGICYGVDIPIVLRSCLFAEKRRKKRDIHLIRLSIIALIALQIHFILFLVVYLIAYEVVFLHDLKSYEIVSKNFLRGNFNPEFINFSLDSSTENKLEEIAKTQQANVIIYGGFSPFVGSGINIGGWSLFIDTSKGNGNRETPNKPSPFTINEIFEYVTSSVRDLKLDKLKVEDNLYVNGQEIRFPDKEITEQEKRILRKLLPEPLMRPNTKLEEADFQAFIENPTNSIRHYRCIRITDWQGELILSIFIKFSMVGQILFIEVNYYLLTPLSPYYHKLDRIKPEASSKDIHRIAVDTFFSTLLLSAASFVSIFIRFSNYKKREQRIREIESNPAYNYGAVTSLRESASYNYEYSRYFQEVDQEMYFKAIERRIVDSLSKFLDSKNIDTSDFKETRSTILNNGIMMSGGSFQGQNISVGKKARSIFRKTNITKGNAETDNNQQ